MTHDEGRNQFRQSMKRIGRSTNTIETYDRNLAQFVSFLTEYYPRIAEVSDVSVDVISDYQDYITGLEATDGIPLSSSTVQLKFIALRSFFKFLVREDYLPSDPTKRIVLPKTGQRLPRSILTEDEVLRILESCDLRTPHGLRNRAILEVFYACGIRTSELCDLAVADVDLRAQSLTVTNGKGGKSRIVPIGQYASHYVSEYLQNARSYFERSAKSDSSGLFLTQFGNRFDRHSINKHVMRPIERGLRLEKPLTCYAFRRSVATHLLQRGVDVSYIARLLGHESLNTTQQYLRIEIGDLKKVHALYHPREKGNTKPRS
jgi:integrase/recombinase XerD